LLRIPSTVRADDLLRHLQDLQSGTYEGAVSRGAKEIVYRRGINLLRPVALEILEEANTLFLNGTGNVQMIGPEEDGYGSLVSRFSRCVLLSTTARASCILTSLQAPQAFGRFKSRARPMPGVREASSLPLSS
jgi:hypothetical protein